MKKVLFLMFLLFLLVLGTAGVRAQVRIGGNAAPNAAAVLDLNATDDATPAANRGALALPRISLADTSSLLNGNTPLNGMLVYNTNTTMTGGRGVGIYLWDGKSWKRLVPATGDITYPVASFALVFSANVNIPALAAGAHTSVTAPGVTFGDMCVGIDVFLYSAQNNVVYITNTWGTAQGALTSRLIRCWRPSST